MDKSLLKCKYDGCERKVDKCTASLLCNHHYMLEYREKTKPGYKVINCEVCKKEIKPKASNQRFCKECQYQRRLQQHYDRNRVEKVNKVCEWCGEEFITNKSFKRFCKKECFEKYDSQKSAKYYKDVIKIRDNRLDMGESYPQKYIFDSIKEKFCNFNWEYDVRTIIKSPITKHMLELDVWCEEKSFAIEFDGEHHFFPIYGEKVFEVTKRNDKLKEELCIEKNIKLLRISYKEDWKNKEWLVNKVGELINDNY